MKKWIVPLAILVLIISWKVFVKEHRKAEELQAIKQQQEQSAEWGEVRIAPSD